MSAQPLFPWEQTGWRPRTGAGGDVVVKDSEFDRIDSLPRRSAAPVDIAALTQYLRTPTGKIELRDVQAQLLHDVYLMRGAVGVLPTGKGKTIPSFLAAMLPHPQDPSRPWVERPVLVVDGSLMGKTAGADYDAFDAPRAIGGDWGRIRENFRTHPNQKVITYQLLQSPTRGVKVLKDLMPDLLVYDEAQACKDEKGSRARRTDAYIGEFPYTIFLALSASFLKRRIREAAHIFWWALRERSPYPRPGSRALEKFGRALDEQGTTNDGDDVGIDGGPLYHFCNSNENLKQGFQRRVAEAPGVVVSFTSSCDAALNIWGVSPERTPPEIVKAFAELRRTNTTPSGDELTDRFSVWRRCRELAFGFYYRWVWPNNQPDIEWLSARAEWRRFVRYVLRHNQRGIDTERRVRDAVDAGLYGDPNKEPLAGNGFNGRGKLADWRRVAPRWYPHPPRETVWISDFVARACAEWLLDGSSKKGRLCWTEHEALGSTVAKIAGVPFFAGGNDGVERHQGPCVVSIHSNSRGRNLQRYSENLFAAVPDGGDTWEQAISRTHRDGQQEDEVKVWVFLHCLELWESFEQARRDARHIQDISGQEQKLNLATLSLLTEQQVHGRLTTSSDPLWSYPRREE